MNYTTISFPGLGLTMDPPQGFDLGPLYINIYGILIALGLMLAVVYACRRCTQFGLKEDDILDGVLWVTPLAIVCARLYYVAFEWEQFASDPISILYIWHGGIAIYGGVIGALVGVAVLCKVKRIKLPALLDLVALGFLIGQAIGRWGNFFNREAFGREATHFLRMGLERFGETIYVHPTFLYESLWNTAGFLLLHKLSKKRQYDGQIALGYVAWYGLGRAFIEGLRTDSLYWGPFRVSQLLAALSCVAAVIVLLLQQFKEHDPKDLLVNKPAEEKPEETEEATEEKAEEPTDETAEEAAEEVTETEEAAEETEEATEEAAEETEEKTEEKTEE